MKRKLLTSAFVAVALLVLAGGYQLYGSERDLNRFYEAAEHGDAHIQSRMGLYYYRGDPFPRDYAKAMKWWKRAANQGYAESQYDVGHMYWYGEGVSKDPIQAYMWAALSANQGYGKAVHDLPELEKEMTSDQIAEAKRRVAAWHPTPEKLTQ